MSLAILARSPAFRRQALSRARGLHTTSPVRGGHGDYHVRLNVHLTHMNLSFGM
jgi:hypothetical protein